MNEPFQWKIDVRNLPLVRCACNCDRCTERTKAMYRLQARCTNCGSHFQAEMRQGDKHPLLVDCPVCGVHHLPIWGGLIV